MKDVKRFGVSDLYHACCGDTIVVNAADYDEALSKLAAETLRADTAEARVKTAEHDLEFFKAGKNEQFDRAEAAEQRVSELTSNDSLESVAKTLAACMDYPWQHMPENGRVLMRKHARDIIDAALNPKPEAGSHE